MTEHAVYSYTIDFQDVDSAGVIFYANLFSIAHRAFEHILAAHGLVLTELLAEGRIALPVVHADADFFHPLRHGDQLRVAMRVAAIKGGSFTARFDVFTSDPDAGPLHASVRQVHACIDRAAGRPIPLDASVRDVLQKLPTAS